MILLYAIVLGIVLGYAFGGRISNLPRLRLRGLWLVSAALVIQILIFPLFTAEPLLPYGTAALHTASYGLLLVWLVLNFRVVPLLVAGSGAMLNVVAVLANGGRMPASASALRFAGLEGVAETLARGESYGNLTGMGAATRLNFLGDWIPLPRALPFATAMSVGDALIMVGFVWLLVQGMTKRA